MCKKVKVLVSVLAAAVLLTVGGAATVMADEEPILTPEPSTKIFMVTANTTGLLARVAEILGIPQEELVNAFKQAQQEMRAEAFIRWLDKAVEEGRITQEEADEIKEWWQQKPEALDQSLLRRIFGFMTPHGKHGWGGKWGMPPGIRQQPWQGMMQRLWQRGMPRAWQQMNRPGTSQGQLG